MPTAGERIAALEAEVAALRDAVAALRLEAVPGALAALAAGQADMAAALRDAAAASHAEARPGAPAAPGGHPLLMAPAAHAAALALQPGPSVAVGTDLRGSWQSPPGGVPAAHPPSDVDAVASGSADRLRTFAVWDDKPDEEVAERETSGEPTIVASVAIRDSVRIEQ